MLQATSCSVDVLAAPTLPFTAQRIGSPTVEIQGKDYAAGDHATPLYLSF